MPHPTLLPAALAAACLGAALHAGDITQPWRMHHIHDDYLVANSMGAADVNGDGFTDYAVIDEGFGRQTILFHPGPGGDVRAPWQRLVLGQTGNPEYSTLADLDGDGALDLVVVEGDDLERGLPTGIRFWWGPGPARATDPTAWTDAGRVPGNDGQQYLYVACRDIDGDGHLDVVVGGRRHSVTRQYAGLRWLRAPADPAARRDLARWETHFIDRDCLSGHAFVFADIDQDGDEDIVDANADWDTHDRDEDLAWYENPGRGEATLQPWRRHVVWRSAQFYAKPQVGVADYDGDGLTDLVTQTQNFVVLFRKTSVQPVAWERIEIRKPAEIQWLGRPMKFADLDADGRLDLVGMLIHNDGNLPRDKASVFWLRNLLPQPPASWPVFPIKWADGANTYRQFVGEKWDHCLFEDVDRDGDLDIVGNVEEHFERVDGQYRPFYSVVWFENPLR
jgi:hypothetical protein